MLGAELLAMKIEVEVLEGLCYKFCIMGESLVRNTKNPADLMMRLFQVDWIEITSIGGPEGSICRWHVESSSTYTYVICVHHYGKY